MVVAIGLSIRPVLGRAESEFHRSIEILDSEQPSQADAVDAVEQEGQRTKRSSSVKVELRRAALFPLSMMEPETEPESEPESEPSTLQNALANAEAVGEESAVAQAVAEATDNATALASAQTLGQGEGQQAGNVSAAATATARRV